MNRTLTIAATIAVSLTVGLPGSGLAEGDAAAGKPLYEINCLICHGVTGAGDGPVGVALQPPPRDFSVGEFMFDTDGDGAKGTDVDLKTVIQKGGMEFGGSALMAPWPTLSEEQIANIVAYIRTLKK